MRNFALCAPLICAFACSHDAVAQWVLPFDGRPVTARDVSGKTICWDTGRKITFGADGRFINPRGRVTTWSVPEPGVIVTGYRRRQIEVLADGELHSHTYKVYRGGGDKNIDHWGKVCE